MVMGAQRARTLSPPPSAPAAASPGVAGPGVASTAQACADRLDQLGPSLAPAG